MDIISLGNISKLKKQIIQLSTDVDAVDDPLTIEEIVDNNDGTFIWKFSDSTEFTTSNLTGPQGYHAIWMSGDTIPADTDGIDGNMYINTATQDIYNKVDGSWNSAGNIQGIQGNSISSIERTDGDGSLGTVDTYTISVEGDSEYTFEIAQGETIKSVERTDGDGSAGTTDTYTIWKDEDKTIDAGTFEIVNGENGTGIISDDKIVDDELWSSTKVNDELVKIQQQAQQNAVAMSMVL